MYELRIPMGQVPVQCKEKLFEGVVTWFNGLSQENQVKVVSTMVVSIAGVAVCAINKGYECVKETDGTLRIKPHTVQIYEA